MHTLVCYHSNVCECGHETVLDVALSKTVLTLLALLLQTPVTEIFIVNLVSCLLQILQVCPGGKAERGWGEAVLVYLEWREVPHT